MRDWLIRTKTKKILGPVEREKLIELFQKGALHPEDEICQGNGFWFFVREKDLLDKYLVKGEQTPYLDQYLPDVNEFEESEEENDFTTVTMLPTADDLATPSDEQRLSLSESEVYKKKEISKPVAHAKAEVQESNLSASQLTSNRKISPQSAPKPTQGDHLLLPLLVIILAVIVGGLFIYRKVLKEPLPLIETSSLIFSNAYAATELAIVKKKQI